MFNSAYCYFLTIFLMAGPALCPISVCEAGSIQVSKPDSVRRKFAAEDIENGKKIAETGNAANVALVPASLVKLFLTGAVFEGQSKGFLDLATTLAATGNTKRGSLDGNLFIQGRGNCFFSQANLQDSVEKIKLQGIKEIAGDLIFDDILMEIKSMPASYQGAAYAATAALGLDLHTVAVTVEPSDPGKPAKVRVNPPNSAVRFAVSTFTTSSGASTIEVKKLDDVSYQVTGNITATSAPIRRRFALNDPALYAAGTLKTLLERAGITVKGAVKRGKMPDNANILATIAGPDMKQLLHDMNVNSINVVAENLLLLLGAERYGAPGTREKGLQALREFLAELDLPMDQVVVADGSGLSNENRVTAEFMTSYLRAVAKKPWFSEFRNTLARPGYDETVKDLKFSDSRFRVKTGVLKDVLALAGYGVDSAGRDVAFTYIVNGPGVGMLPLDTIGGEALRYLANEVHL